LTLALLDGLIVNVAGRRYVAPLFSIRESIRPTAGMLRRTAVGAWIAEVRGEFMPVVRLGRRFAIPGASEDPRQGLLIVSEGSGRRFCLAVDEILGKQELAVKALSGPLPRIPGISSVALLGDGGVGLILDIEALYEESPILEISSDSR
jgi:two-component system chemotaxis sensor kinase CheA